MKTSSKLLSGLLAAVCIIGAAGCGGGGGRGTNDNNGSGETTTTTAATTTADPNAEFIVEEDLNSVAENYEYNEKNEAGAGSNYKKGESAGSLKLFLYYNPKNIDPEKSIMPLFAERFGGTIDTEYKMASGSLEYMNELSTFIQADDAPDIVRMEWDMLPGYILKNSFTAMDDWVDLSDPVWESVVPAADGWAVKGKHYYYPTRYASDYGVGYNTKCIEDIGEEDPMDLYDKDEWDWNAMERMLGKWMQQSNDKIGMIVGESSALKLTCTTGVSPITINGSDIINNLKDEKVMRAMSVFEGWNRKGYINNTGEWIDPTSLRAWEGKILFTIMPAEWTLDGQKVFYQKDLEGELRVVPLPKDPESDTKYLPSNTYGYLVPAGAKNLQGATAWILAARIYETDPEVLEQRYKEATWTGPYYVDKCVNKECDYVYPANSRFGEPDEVCPECGTPRREQWLKRQTERQYQIYQDMIDSSKYTFVIDAHRGFGSDIESLMHGDGNQTRIFDTPFMTNPANDSYRTYSQLVDEYYTMVESLLDNYRALLK